jgi:hypothetical protein
VSPITISTLKEQAGEVPFIAAVHAQLKHAPLARPRQTSLISNSPSRTPPEISISRSGRTRPSINKRMPSLSPPWCGWKRSGRKTNMVWMPAISPSINRTRMALDSFLCGRSGHPGQTGCGLRGYLESFVESHHRSAAACALPEISHSVWRSISAEPPPPSATTTPAAAVWSSMSRK